MRAANDAARSAVAAQRVHGFTTRSAATFARRRARGRDGAKHNPRADSRRRRAFREHPRLRWGTVGARRTGEKAVGRVAGLRPENPIELQIVPPSALP